LVKLQWGGLVWTVSICSHAVSHANSIATDVNDVPCRWRWWSFGNVYSEHKRWVIWNESLQCQDNEPWACGKSAAASEMPIWISLLSYEWRAVSSTSRDVVIAESCGLDCCVYSTHVSSSPQLTDMHMLAATLRVGIATSTQHMFVNEYLTV